jgi:restriction endonuclease S subunit
MSAVSNEAVNPPAMFITSLTELSDRFDPEMVLFRRKVHQFRYPVRKLRDFFSEPPQYGAGERGLLRETPGQPRYIRITDIDEYGLLADELGATAATVEPRYLLEDDDLLLARSGNTVGKSYLHKANQTPYICLFAGYLIRFKFKQSEMLPEFVFAITQLSYYKQWVKAIQRAAGQPNINAQEFSNLEIPAAPIPIQQKIIALLQDAYAVKRARDDEAKALLRSIDEVMLSELGIRRKPELTNTLSKRIFFTSFEMATGERWDPNYSRKMSWFLSELKSCVYPVHKLRDFVALVQYGISELATSEQVGVPMLRMLNLQDGEWSLSDLKYIAMSEAEKLPYLLRHDDILFNRTNSKELVGKCNVFNMEGEYVFASYLMRVRLKDTDLLRPEFLVEYMASSLGRIQIDAVSRQIAGMTNINAEEVRELLIPIPPRHIQDRVYKRVAAIRAQAGQLRRQASTELERVKRKIERTLLDSELST